VRSRKRLRSGPMSEVRTQDDWVGCRFVGWGRSKPFALRKTEGTSPVVIGRWGYVRGRTGLAVELERRGGRDEAEGRLPGDRGGDHAGYS
jgi:hypothetical protein